jgi:tetratricopeptide (TPR) repeat protein
VLKLPFRALFVLQAFLLLGSFGLAQSFVLELPRPSQHAVITQRIGITDVTINYHRPMVNKRKVWGGLVPYGQVWRAGANENTTIKFTDPVTIEGKPLPAGAYGLHMLPGENEWTVIFSRNSTSWGSFTYNQAEDALRVSVKPQATEFHEVLTYDFDDVNPDSTVVTLRWEKVAVPFKVGVNTHEIVAQNLHNQLRGLAQYSWEGWDDAASYLLQEKIGLDEALTYSDKSIQNEARYDNVMTKSRVLDALGRKEEAATARDKALTMANAIQLHSYARQMQIDGKQTEAFAIYRDNAKKNPDQWIVHVGLSRMYSAQGDFANAAKEMNTAVAGAPDGQKVPLQAFAKRLEAKQDINK